MMIKADQVNVNDPNIIAFAHRLRNAIRGRDLHEVKRVTDWFRWRDGLTHPAVIKVLRSIHASRYDLDDYEQQLYELDGKEWA